MRKQTILQDARIAHGVQIIAPATAALQWLRLERGRSSGPGEHEFASLAERPGRTIDGVNRGSHLTVDGVSVGDLVDILRVRVSMY